MVEVFHADLIDGIGRQDVFAFRKHGRHVVIGGDAPEAYKRYLKYKVFADINARRYQRFLDIMPKDEA